MISIGTCILFGAVIEALASHHCGKTRHHKCVKFVVGSLILTSVKTKLNCCMKNKLYLIFGVLFFQEPTITQLCGCTANPNTHFSALV